MTNRTPAGRHGAPYKRLAREVERRRDPTFTFDPPYPDLPYSTLEELRVAGHGDRVGRGR